MTGYRPQSDDVSEAVDRQWFELLRDVSPVERLRMVVVQDTLRDLAHAVLAVYLDDDVVILDNLTNAVLSHDRVFQYVPYYSVNETTRWAHVPPGRITLSMNVAD